MQARQWRSEVQFGRHRFRVISLQIGLPTLLHCFQVISLPTLLPTSLHCFQVISPLCWWVSSLTKQISNAGIVSFHSITINHSLSYTYYFLSNNSLQTSLPFRPLVHLPALLHPFHPAALLYLHLQPILLNLPRIPKAAWRVVRAMDARMINLQKVRRVQKVQKAQRLRRVQKVQRLLVEVLTRRHPEALLWSRRHQLMRPQQALLFQTLFHHRMENMTLLQYCWCNYYRVCTCCTIFSLKSAV